MTDQLQPPQIPSPGNSLTFLAGQGANGGEGGEIVFVAADGSRALVIQADGTFLVGGVPVCDISGQSAVRDRLVYSAFRTWLSQSHLNLCAGARLVQTISEEPQEWENK